MVEIKDVASLRSQVGREIAVSDWLVVTQERIYQFAEATGDRQWIHTDPERARRELPFGTTIAHGFLTLSLLSELIRSALHFEGLKLAVNCGLNRVRFVSPVPAGSRVRARIVPASVGEIAGTIQVIWNITIELEASEKPAAVAEWIVRYYA